jgi:hypothetical protein
MTTHFMLWLPLLAASAHIFEEFVWPGGFAEWYRRFDPGAAASVTTRFLVGINLLLLALCAMPRLLGATPRGVSFWLTASAVCAGNALFHIYATWRMREYSPGIVTGVLLYIPLAIFGFTVFLRQHAASTATAIQALLIGAAYVYGQPGEGDGPLAPEPAAYLDSQRHARQN